MGLQDDLRRCVERRSWTSLRGRFTSRGEVPLRFVFRRPGDWRFESTIDDDVLATEGAEQLMGAKADHAWLASGATLIAASPRGRAAVGADLWRLVHPERALLVPERLQRYLREPLPTTYDQLDVQEDQINERPVWTVVAGDDTIMVDQAHGVGLRHLRAKGDAVIDDLEVDCDIPDDCFRPPAADPGSGRPRWGVAYISEYRDRPDAPVATHWEVRRPSGLAYVEWAPVHHTVNDAVVWGRARAQTVIVRTGDGNRYTAGELPPQGDLLPPWPG